MSTSSSSKRTAIAAGLASRRGRVGMAILLALIAAAVVVVVLLSASSVEPPATGAARVVPGDALAYIHISVDPKRPVVRGALKVGSRFPTFPLLSVAADSRLAQIAGGGTKVSYSTDIRPWLGKEAAIAFLNTQGSTAGSEIVLDVRHRAGAQRFLTQVGAAATGSYQGVTLYRLRTGTELAFVRHYLVVGQAATVQAAIDSSAGRRASLARTAAYARAASGEPAGRVIDAYFSAAGVTRVLAAQGGLIGALGAVLYEPGLIGSTISISPTTGGASVYVHAALDPRAAASGASRSFTPSLTQVLPSGSLLMVDVMDLAHAAPRLLGTSAAAGVAGRLGPLLSHLGVALAAEGVNVHALEALFSGETAVSIGSTDTGAPALVVVTKTAHVQRVRQQLAALQVPLANLFPAPRQGGGSVPQFSSRRVAGVTVHELSLAPGLSLGFSVFRGLLVISTSLKGIAAVAHHTQSVAQEPGFQQTLPDQPSPVTSLVFLDFSQLLRLAEQTGLTRSTRYQALQPDLGRIRAVGLETTKGRADSTAEITLQIR